MLAVSPLSRFALSAPTAAGITVGLAALMQALVTVAAVVEIEREPTPAIDFLTETIDTPPERIVRPTTVLVEPPPVVTRASRAGDETEPAPVPITREPPPVEQPEAGPVFLAQSARRLFTPVPVYPANAGDREGSCRVRFDVDASGRVRNAEAVSCTQSVFARAAEETVQRSVYQPAMGEQGPVATTGLTLEIVFQLGE